jgi:flavodoxin I
MRERRQQVFEVIYSSRGGNTRKIAEAIAEGLQANAQNVKTKEGIAQDTTLVIGSGIYAGGPAKELTAFIDRIDLSGRKVALFSTSAEGSRKQMAKLIEAVEAKNANIIGEFYCRGKFLFASRKHPDEQDLANARKFAEDIVKANSG